MKYRESNTVGDVYTMEYILDSTRFFDTESASTEYSAIIFDPSIDDEDNERSVVINAKKILKLKNNKNGKECN